MISKKSEIKEKSNECFLTSQIIRKFIHLARKN